MFCPNCGTGSAADQKFCRGCGLKLEKVSLLVAEQLPAGSLAESSPEEVARLLKRKQCVERLLAGIGLTAGGLFVLAIILTIIFKLMIPKGEYLEGGFFLGLILAAVTMLALVVYRETVTESLARRGVTDEQAAAPPVAAPTAKLLHESRLVPVPSVTDRTTELLAAEHRRTTKEVVKEAVSD